MITLLSMHCIECTKCHKNLSLDNFSIKNAKEMIYYLHCNNCRNKIENETKKEREKEQYEMVKQTNVINCSCGACFVSFRTYHYARHMNSKKHKAALKQISKNI